MNETKYIFEQKNKSKPAFKKMTNRERVEQMTVKELCEKYSRSLSFLVRRVFGAGFCEHCEFKRGEVDRCVNLGCEAGLKSWLDSEEAENGNT